MNQKISVIYWKSDKFYLGKIIEHPEIMTQGKTVDELLENLKDAYNLMIYEDVPDDYQKTEILL